jgi:hypothetical protein
MALIHADDLLRLSSTPKRKRANDNPTLTQAVRDHIMELVKPLFEGIRHEMWIREQEINEAFESTGFDYGEAWEALPHSGMSDSLLPLYSYMEKVKDEILNGTAKEIKVSIEVLLVQARERFREVDEFLEGRLSRMPESEWRKRYSNFHRDFYLPALEDGNHWTIGTFVRPSKEVAWKKAVREAFGQ